MAIRAAECSLIAGGVSMKAAVEAEFREIDEHGSWNAIFQEVRDQSVEFPCAVARLPENKVRNRYRDVSPFDHSRICLQLGTNDYINASLISMQETERRYILAQGPLPNTCGHFWEMVWEQRSRGVVMLNRVVEKGSVKCAQYWPSQRDQEMVFEDTNFKVALLSEDVKSYYTVRELELENLSTQETREVLHFHYTTWPDFGVPESPASFLNFLFKVRESGCLSPDHGPAVVHCSAGIGRSGTFCLVDSCLLLMSLREDPSSVYVREVLLQMRHYRMGLIQTADQLRFSYLSVIEGARLISGDASVQESWKELSKEEDPPAELTPPPPRPPKRSCIDPHSSKTGSFLFPLPEVEKLQHSFQANGCTPEPELRRRVVGDTIDATAVPSDASAISEIPLSAAAPGGPIENPTGLSGRDTEGHEALPQENEGDDQDLLDSGSPTRLLSPLLATMCLGMALALGVYVCSRASFH